VLVLVQVLVLVLVQVLVLVLVQVHFLQFDLQELTLL
jgi:hypothetical protein